MCKLIVDLFHKVECKLQIMYLFTFSKYMYMYGPMVEF